MSRSDILNKFMSLGIGSSRVGKNNIQTLQTLFLKSFDFNQNYELPVALFINTRDNSKICNLSLLSNDVAKAINQVNNCLFNYTSIHNDCIYYNSLNPNILHNLDSNSNTIMQQQTGGFFKLPSKDALVKTTNLANLLLLKSNFENIDSTNILPSNLKVKASDSHKNKNTFLSNSNKLNLIYNLIKAK